MTVQQWLELARDAGLPWAESALAQMDSDAPSSEAHSLQHAIRQFTFWEFTQQGPSYWADVAETEHVAPHSEEYLRALAEARKEAL